WRHCSSSTAERTSFLNGFATDPAISAKYRSQAGRDSRSRDVRDDGCGSLESGWCSRCAGQAKTHARDFHQSRSHHRCRGCRGGRCRSRQRQPKQASRRCSGRLSTQFAIEMKPMRRVRRAKLRPIVVSFSGIDGCGKSTQIEILSDRLRKIGLRVRHLGFWDDVALLKGWREFTSHAVFGSEEGVGTPDRPVNRRDKTVRSWYRVPVRWFLYLLDAMSLCNTVVSAESVDADVIIFARYLYDELATLPLDRPFSRVYAQFLMNLVPQPDIAYWLDADPDEARQRK